MTVLIVVLLSIVSAGAIAVVPGCEARLHGEHTVTPAYLRR